MCPQDAAYGTVGTLTSIDRADVGERVAERCESAAVPDGNGANGEEAGEGGAHRGHLVVAAEADHTRIDRAERRERRPKGGQPRATDDEVPADVAGVLKRRE